MAKKVTSAMMKSATSGNQYPVVKLPNSKNPERYKKVKTKDGKLFY